MALADVRAVAEVSDVLLDPRSGEIVTPFTGDPLPTSNRVIHWETHRGRNDEFSQTEAGTGAILLRNRDGLFDPLNESSPYTASDNLLPIRQVRITANTPAHPTTYHPIFTGYVEDWSYERRGPRDATCTLNLMDGFELLNNAQIFITRNNKSGGHFFESLHVDDRIRAALGFAGWPSARQSIYTGNVVVQDMNYNAGTSMLQVIQEAVEAEFPGLANFYMDRSGTATFRGRKFRFDPFNSSAYGANVAKLWKFGDDESIAAYTSSAYPDVGTLIPMANLSWTYTKDHLYNVCQFMPANLDPRVYYNQVVSDSVLAARYGKRDFTVDGLIVRFGSGEDISGGGPTIPQSAAQECKRMANYYLQSYKHPSVRATQLEVHSKFETDLVWNFLVNVEIGDVVELYTINPGGVPFGTIPPFHKSGFYGEQFYVDGISNRVDAEGKWPKWICTLDLTPRAYFQNFPPPYPVGALTYAVGAEEGYAYPPDVVSEDRPPDPAELQDIGKFYPRV